MRTVHLIWVPVAKTPGFGSPPNIDLGMSALVEYKCYFDPEIV